MHFILQAACLAIMILLHLYVARLVFIRYIPRSPALSAAGGVATAYIFIHILPELEKMKEVFAREARGLAGLLEYHPYYIALFGFVLFYGLERAAVISRRSRRSGPVPAVFWLHIASFTLYNVLIGYLLFNLEDDSVANTILFTAAIGLHFVVNDFSLRNHYRDRYHRIGRWIVSGGVLLGAGLAQTVTIRELYLSIVYAVLAGGVILNSIKEELPEQHKSRFSAFAGGALAYSAILFFVE